MKVKLPLIDADLIRAALALISTNDDPRIVTKVVHINNLYIEATNGSHNKIGHFVFLKTIPIK